MIETYLNKFEENGISIQITLDVGKEPTVHAIDKAGDLHKTQHETLFLALDKMSDKLFS